MKLNRIALLLLVAVLCLSTAAAETKLNEHTFSWYTVEVNKLNNTMMVKESRNSDYYLTDAAGNRISDIAYTDVRVNDAFYRVATSDGLNRYGVIDAAGQQVLPMAYGDVKFISNDWIAGVVLEPATEDNYDYSTYDKPKKFYKVMRYDMYFDGQLVGNLGRTDYNYTTARGKYLFISNKAGAYTAYTPDFTGREVKSTTEYDYNYKTKSVTHNATGTQAFCPDCTLTAEDVERSLYEIDGVYYDLQGNAVFVDDHYIVYSFYGNYAKTGTKTDLYGLIDKTGAVILPEEFEKIDQTYSNDSYFACGYQPVGKDGKLGIASLNEGYVWMSDYSSSVKHSISGPFVFITDMDGTTIVLDGAIGQLPVHYADVSHSSQSNAPVFVAKDSAGQCGVVGMLGEEVIPFTNTRSMYNFDITYDGSVIVCKDDDYHDGKYTYHLYQMEYDMPTDCAKVLFPTNEEPALNPGEWVCPECSNVNTGKFCPECGTAKPVSAEWTCPQCNTVNSSKFCPECGTARP